MHAPTPTRTYDGVTPVTEVTEPLWAPPSLPPLTPVHLYLTAAQPDQAQRQSTGPADGISICDLQRSFWKELSTGGAVSVRRDRFCLQASGQPSC